MVTVNQTASATPLIVVNFGWFYNNPGPSQLIVGGQPATPLNTTIFFDATDSASLGLPKPTVPAGVTIASYNWDFGNGQTGQGPLASTTFSYPIAIPGFQVSLVIVDSLGRSTSCPRQINLQSVAPGSGGFRESPGTARS